MNIIEEINIEEINIEEINIEEINIEEINIKKIIIEDSQKNKNTKKINCKKEKKMRVETKTWGLNEEELSHQIQFNILKNILYNILENEKDNEKDKEKDNEKDNEKDKEKNKYISMFLAHIKNKIRGYKQQDILKKKLDEQKLVKFKEVIEILEKCEMKCHYCSEQVFILYEKVLESRQWTLDRINNDIGHNNGNLVVACLECNLKRRRTNKDAFMFTKNMVINREGI